MFRSAPVPLRTKSNTPLGVFVILLGASLLLMGIRGLQPVFEIDGDSTSGRAASVAERQQGFRPMLEQSELAQGADPITARSLEADYRAGDRLERLLAPAEPGEALAVPNRPVRLVIPEIRLNAPVISAALLPAESEQQAVYQWVAPDFFAAGWHHDSAQLREPGNMVLNGHHNAYGEVFRDLNQLEKGDRIFVYGNEDSVPHRYEVTEVVIVEERFQSLESRIQNARWIQNTEDERLTLITCWPYETNTHRLIIVAKPLDTGIGGGYMELE